MNFKKWLACALLSTMIASALADNDTTANLKGSVNVENATVKVVYEPTGLTKSRDLGNAKSFSFSFLPVGGPYTITVAAEGFETIKMENVFLALYQKTSFPFELKPQEIRVDEALVVVAQKPINPAGSGTGSVMYREDMDSIPTVSRSIADVTRLDPRVNIDPASSNIQISAMGVNNRYNDFQIDGVSFNDPFGLNASGFATFRSPISMDFVEQVAVDLTPYDVSRSGATGATISVVTKSGTNELDGSIYYSSRNEDNFSDLPNNSPFPPFDDEVLNLTLSGPIIKDKLFFFVGYEEFELTQPFTYGPAGSGALNESDATAAEFEEIAQIARDVYGFDPGGYESLSFPETAEEYVIKLDYHINDDHRLSLNHSNKEELNWSNTGLDRFQSVAYTKPPITERTTISYFGDITPNFNIKASYTNYDFTEDAESDGGLFPEARVETASGAEIYLGGEKYRGANYIAVNHDTLSLKANYIMGDHVLTGGFVWEEGKVQNQFLARYNGEVQFDSIDDFRNGQWSYLRFQVPTAGLDRLDTITADFDVEKLSYFLQDEWVVNDKLNVQFGVRMDSLSTPTAPVENAAFVAEYGYSNAQKFDYSVFQPRASFELDLSDNIGGSLIKTANLRGGFGLFMGRFPNVWLGNAYSRPGPLSDYRRFYDTDPLIGPMPSDATFFWLNSPDSSYEIAPPGSSTASQYIDPDFEAPSTWRGNIAVDMEFSDGSEVTLEYNYDRANKALAVRDPGLEMVGTLADGRGVFETSGSLELTNTDEGEASSITVTYDKKFFNSLNFYTAYTNTDSKDVWNMTSSQAESNFGYQQRFGNQADLTTSQYNIEHNFLMSLDYAANWFGSNETRISLLWQRKSGEPYSITFDNGYNGLSGISYGGYDLAYIPTGADDAAVEFASAEVAGEVMAFIAENGLDAFAGSYAPRNALNQPWQSRIDLRIMQEIRFPDFWLGENKAVITLDIINLGEDEVEQVSNNTSRAIITDGVNNSGQIIITGVDADDNFYTRADEGQSSLGYRLGFKYQF